MPTPGSRPPTYTSLARRTSFGCSITPQLADQLVEAVQVHPTMRTAAHSCGVPIKTLQDWVRRGGLPGADPKLAEFVDRFMKANADKARRVMADFEAQAAAGSTGAAQTLKFMQVRWKDTEADDIEAMLASGAKKTDSLEQLLLHPTPRLRGILDKCGWMSKPGFNHDNVVETTGETKPEET